MVVYMQWSPTYKWVFVVVKFVIVEHNPAPAVRIASLRTSLLKPSLFNEISRQLLAQLQRSIHSKDEAAENANELNK